VIVCVRADSPLKTGRDLVERLKQDPGAHTFGIATSLGNINHQSVAMALKQAGVDLRKTRNVVFQAATLGVTAMLGGHVDVVPVALGTAAGPLQSGQIRLLAVAAPRRVPGIFAHVPTWRELGYDVVASNWRSVIGPKGLPAAQTAYWEQALQRVTESPEWKKDLEQNHWDSEFIGAAGTRKLMDADYAQAKSLLVDLELAK
jgi:putative tricarboxylic transport membrane protein